MDKLCKDVEGIFQRSEEGGKGCTINVYGSVIQYRQYKEAAKVASEYLKLEPTQH